jgi:hypothetical protein
LTEQQTQPQPQPQPQTQAQQEQQTQEGKWFEPPPITQATQGVPPGAPRPGVPGPAQAQVEPPKKPGFFDKLFSSNKQSSGEPSFLTKLFSSSSSSSSSSPSLSERFKGLFNGGGNTKKRNNKSKRNTKSKRKSKQ